MLCTVTPDISSSSENINSTACVSRYLFVSYDYDITPKLKMADLHMHQQDMVSKDISSYVLIITKYTRKFIFFIAPQ